MFNHALDPDFVGYLTEIGGLDSAEVREASEDIPGWDGAEHGPFYAGRRPVTLEGFVHVDGITPTIRNSRVDKLLRATLALRADATLKWQESGGVGRQVSLRRQSPTRITGRRPKNFLVAMVAADPRVVSQALHSDTVAASAAAQAGFNFPLNFPLDFTEFVGATASISVTNAGNGDAIPSFVVTGPILNPRIENLTTGKELRLAYNLGAGETLTLDGQERTILLNGTIDRYSALDFSASEWWTLEPGANTVRLQATASSSPAGLAITWRDTWL